MTTAQAVTPTAPAAAITTASATKKKPRPVGPVVNMPSATDTFRYSGGQKTVVQSLIGGGEIFAKIDEVLNIAKNKPGAPVYLDMYNFQTPALYPTRVSAPGTPGADIQGGLADRLIDLKKSGHDVKVVIDHHWDTDFNEGYNDRTIDFLRKGGVDVVTYPDYSKISHVKVLMVDNQYAIIGGMNWGNHSPTNHDACVFIQGPDVANIVHDIFAADWQSAGRKASELQTANPFENGKIKVLTTSSPDSARGEHNDIYNEILHQIDTAQESIHAELFVLTQTEIVNHLIAAHKRLTAAGKEGVKILVDPGLYFSFPNARRGILNVVKAGVPIRFYEADQANEEKLHAKWAVFDRQRTLVGSANWSTAGLLATGVPNDPQEADDFSVNSPGLRHIKGNHEAGVLVDSAKIAAPYVQQVLYDFEHKSFPIIEKGDDGKWHPVKPDPNASPEAAAAAAAAVAAAAALPAEAPSAWVPQQALPSGLSATF